MKKFGKAYFLCVPVIKYYCYEQVLSCWVMIIPIPLPQHQHTVSDKKCAGAEGEELVLLLCMTGWLDDWMHD